MAAYTVFIIFLAVVGIGLAAASFNVIINEFVTAMNPTISGGDVSTQWVYYWNFIIGIWNLFPVIGLLILAIWAIIRVIEKRRMEGGA